MSGWPNLSDLFEARDAAAPVAMLGAPLAAGSVTPGCCDQAPHRLRAALRRTGLYDVETGRSLSVRVADLGEVDITGLGIEAATGHIRFERYVIVQDSGTIINPLIVDGQLCGATAQGIGGVVHEAVRYDDIGQPLATTFMDYLVPSSLDIPPMTIEYMQSPFEANPIGAKGVGESGVCFAPAAVITAVGDALGVPVDHFGVSPSNVHALMLEAGLVPAGRAEASPA